MVLTVGLEYLLVHVQRLIQDIRLGSSRERSRLFWKTLLYPCPLLQIGHAIFPTKGSGISLNTSAPPSRGQA